MIHLSTLYQQIISLSPLNTTRSYRFQLKSTNQETEAGKLLLRLKSITRRHGERAIDQIVSAGNITRIIGLRNNAALIQRPSGVDILATTARVVFVVVAAVSASVVVEKVVLSHKEREVALVLERPGCVDLVVGG